MAVHVLTMPGGTWWVVAAVVVEGAELRDVTEVEAALHSPLAQALPHPPAPLHVLGTAG